MVLIVADAGEPGQHPVDFEAAEQGRDVEPKLVELLGNEKPVVTEGLVKRHENEAAFGRVDLPSFIVGDVLRLGDLLEAGIAGMHHEPVVGADEMPVPYLEHPG